MHLQIIFQSKFSLISSRKLTVQSQVVQGEDGRLRQVTLDGDEDVAFIGRDAPQVARIAYRVAWVRLLQLYGTQFNVVKLSWHRSDGWKQMFGCQSRLVCQQETSISIAIGNWRLRGCFCSGEISSILQSIKTSESVLVQS